MRLLIAATAVLALCSGGANAACTLDKLAGKWTVSQSSTSEICGINIADTGLYTGTCRTYKSGGNIDTSVAVTGRFKVTASCRIIASMTKGKTTRSMGGKTDRPMQLMLGIYFRSGGFTAFRNR